MKGALALADGIIAEGGLESTGDFADVEFKVGWRIHISLLYPKLM